MGKREWLLMRITDKKKESREKRVRVMGEKKIKQKNETGGKGKTVKVDREKQREQ